MLTEFEPGRLTLTEARALIALILAFQPDALPKAGDVSQLTLVFEEPSDAKAAFAADGAPSPAPDPAEAFAPVGESVAGGAAAPGGSMGTPTSGPAAAPATASVSPGPTPPATASVPSSPTPLLDTAGLPWDERIHAGSKNTNADGTWRTKKGLPSGVKESVVAELRATYADPRAAAAAVLQAAATSPAAAVAVTAPPPPPPPPPPAPMGIDKNPTDFAGTMKLITLYKNEGKITQEQIAESMAVCDGISGLGDMVKRVDQIPTFVAMLNQFAAG